MKSIFITLLFSILTISCSKNVEHDSNLFPQKWKLIKMTGSFPNSETTGDEMEWQEYYIFNKDKSFIKNGERGGVTTEVSGTYEIIEDSDETLYELNFNALNPLIGSCYAGTVEKLIAIDSISIMSTWEQCDGPGLIYERTE